MLVAGGDQRAFEDLYGLVAGPVFGLVRRVVRDPAQSEEVAREVLLELWRPAARFDPGRGSALSWILASPPPATTATPTVKWPSGCSLPLGTVKTRMRDGLARLRGCLGGTA